MQTGLKESSSSSSREPTQSCGSCKKSSLNLDLLMKIPSCAVDVMFMQELMTKSDASFSVKYLQTMVECLALLGKIAAAGAIIRCENN